jgi:hypothetical protein
MGDAALASAVRGLTGDWKSAEQAIAAELGASPRRARRTVGAFARVAEASGVREARGRAARLRASLLTYASKWTESRAAYRAAIALLEGAPRDGARIGLAAVETRLGRFAAARALCREARRAARARGDALLAAGADANEAMALHESGSTRAAVPLYERARAAFAAAGNRRLEARTAMDLANALVLLDRYAEASPLFESASRAFAALGQSFDGAKCRYNAGALAVSMERLGDADVALADAESAFRAAGDGTFASLARLDRGEAMLRAGLVPEALRLLESARRGLGRGAPPVERTRAAHLAARAALALGDARAARRFAAGARSRGLSGADAEKEEIAGRALALEGRVAAARTRLERAARLHGAGRPAARARCLAVSAWCAARTDDLAAARRLASASARTAAPLGVASLDFGAAAVLFLAEDAAGRRGPADRAMRRSVAALERVRAGLGSDAMRSALLAGREEWLARAVRHALAGKDGPAAALALVERFRARALIDLLGASDSAAPRDERVAALRARVAVLERRAEGATPAAFLRAPAAAPRARELRAAERALAGAAAAPSPLLDTPDLESLRAALPDGTLVLSLFDDGTTGVVFVVGRDEIRVGGFSERAGGIAPLVEDLRYTLGKFALGDDYARRHAARLARECAARLEALAALSVAPLAGEIARARRVVVVPHGAWHLVPFAALPVAGRPLALHAPVALSPAFGALSARVPAATGPSLVLSAADVAAPTIDDEGRAVASALPEAHHFTGDDARFDVLAAARSPRCVHVAAHGRYRPDAPSMGGVRLADGWLRAIDFASLRLPGALVVLSGCETGVSRVGPGDEVHGLVRGVFASGAAELVASLWRVGDEATARFMAEFHRRRAAGARAERALAETQRAAVAAGVPVWAWAGFALWTRRLADA